MVRYAMIEGHPGYRVGTDGSVWSCIKRGNQKGVYLKTWTRLKPSQSGNYGHTKVTLHTKQRLIHILVLEAFRGPRPFPEWDSRHLDGNAGNNRLSNLRWGTKAENGLDRIRHGTPPVGEGHPNSKLTEADVRDIRLDTASTRAVLADRYGVSPALITAVKQRIIWKHVTN